MKGLSPNTIPNTLRSKESVFLSIQLLVIGHTWKSTFHDRSFEDLLGELRLVVILIRHCDHDLHGVFNCIPIRRHGVRVELQQPSEGYLGPNKEKAMGEVV